jgi:transcriptional regulator with XRE-family HTH domain
MQDSLGHRLRVMRAERGLTLREAAARSGVAKETISDAERDLRHPHDVTLAKLAHAYDVPVEGLLEEPLLAGKDEASETGASRPRLRLGQLHPEGGDRVTAEQLRELGFPDVSSSEVAVLNQMLAYRERPTGEIHAFGYVEKKDEPPVDFDQVEHMLIPAYLLATGAISENDLREARKAISELKELVGGAS